MAFNQRPVPEWRDARRTLGAAKELVRALPEGRALLEYASDRGLDIEAGKSPMPAFISFKMKTVRLHHALTAAEMASFLPHEIMHDRQLTQKPELAAADSLLFSGGGGQAGYRGKILHPRDFLWARMAMEMGAFAIQADFAVQMLEKTGEGSVLKAFCNFYPFLMKDYMAATSQPFFEEFRVDNRPVMKITPAESMTLLQQRRRDYAAAAVAYSWFWRGLMPDTGAPGRLHYNDFVVARMDERCRNGALSSAFNGLARGGLSSHFVRWDRNDIVAMNEGYPVNPLNVPGFDDVSGPAYRHALTRENYKITRRVERVLGLT